VVAAAGSGQRLGAGGPKAFVDLGGRALIEWSLAALDAARSIGAIVIAAPAGFEREAELAAELAAPQAAVVVTPGGATRAASIELALEHVRGDLVAIHDAARPLIGAGLVDRIVGRLEADPGADAAIAAAPLTDTVKRARGCAAVAPRRPSSSGRSTVTCSGRRRRRRRSGSVPSSPPSGSPPPRAGSGRRPTRRRWSNGPVAGCCSRRPARRTSR